VVVKLDREGCLAAEGESVTRVSAPRTQAVNATGAGDAFNAALLDRWLAGETLANACRSAVALGSFATSLSTTR
jgi:2-dehydro-3-deoxygluconokinase